MESLVARITRFARDHREVLKRILPVRRVVQLHLAEFRMFVPLDDWVVGAKIALRRRYEPHVTAAMRPWLQPGTVVLDVGANLGYHTLTAASRVGAAGKVIAVEASSENCAVLTRSLRVNAFDNVVVHCYAAADVTGLVGLKMDDSNGGIKFGDPSASPMQVQATTLDVLLANEPRIDVIKMDIEGCEGRALRGMRALLRRHRPVLFTEFCPSALAVRSGMTGEQYLDELRERAYLLTVIDRRPRPGPAPQTNPEIMAQVEASGLGYVDLLARPG